MSQPVKKQKKKYINTSEELSVLLGYIIGNFVEVYGVDKVTPEIYVFMGLEYEDCLLYKLLNTLLTESSLEEMHDEIGELINYTGVTINSKFDFFKDKRFSEVFSSAIDEMEVTKSKLITSDHILLSILKNSQSKKLNAIMNDYGVNYDALLKNAKKIHDLTSEVFENEEESVKKNVTKGNSLLKVDFCTNLMTEYECGKINETYGLENEITQVFKILAMKNNNNALIVGKKGVGKTQCVYGVVESIFNNNAPIMFQEKTIWRLNPIELFAGTSVRGSLEERILRLVKQLNASKDNILFIDDLNTLLSKKNNNSDSDMTCLFNQIITNPNIMVICCCAYNNFKQAKDNYEDIISTFQNIVIDEMKEGECIKMLKNTKKIYEKYHNVKYSDSIVETIVNLSKRYVTDKSLPLSAIEVMDEIGSNKKISNPLNDSFNEIRKDISKIEKDKEKSVKEDNLGKVEEMNKEIETKRNDLSKIMKSSTKKTYKIIDEDVFKVISEHTGISIDRLNVKEKEKLQKIEDTLKRRIIGQDEAIKEISNAIKRNKVGLSRKNCPLLTALSIGPTGVGKTLLAKTLAKEILGDEKYLVRFDMSEYSDETSINKLIGSSSGYVGYTEGGLLTEAIKRNKYCVLLFDEIEKANQKVFNLFLQILDDGVLTDNMGQKVDFKNCYILMTSNIGTQMANEHKSIGFNTNDDVVKKNIIEKQMRKKFPPEFLNRFDNIIIFNRLSEEDMKKITILELEDLKKRLKDIGFGLCYDEKVVNHVCEITSKDRDYGARPIKRVIKKDIENEITDLLISNDYKKHIFEVKSEENKLSVL